MMALFGWLVVVLIAVVVSFGTAMCSYAQLVLSDKIDKSTILPIALCVLLWYIVCVSCPLTVVVN